MNEFINNKVSEKIKKILKEKVDKTEPYSTILEYANARLYISYEGSEEFEYTNLEGCLCLVVSRKFSNLYLQLYEYVNNKREFEIELYSNIEKGYTVLNDTFHSIEYSNFFLGINFANKINAEKLKNAVLYNSIIVNAQTSLYSISSDAKKKSDDIRNMNLVSELDYMAKIENIEKVEKTVTFYINREENNLVIDIKKDIFEKSLPGLYWINIETHCKKIRSSVLKQEENVNKSNRDEKKFVEFDPSKRKSVMYSKVGGNKNSDYNNKEENEDEKIPSTRLYPQMQNRFNENSNTANTQEPRTIQEEIRMGVKLKAIPKTNEKKPIKVTPLSSDPQLQMALKMQSNNNQMVETENSDGEDD